MTNKKSLTILKLTFKIWNDIIISLFSDIKSATLYKHNYISGDYNMKKALLYIVGILIAIAMICFSLTVLANTQIVAPVIIGLSVYLILGFIIKLCRMSDKIKNTVICTIDLLFFLPWQRIFRFKSRYTASSKSKNFFSALVLLCIGSF